MGYEAALRKAWEEVETAGGRGTEEVRFFTEDLRVDIPGRQILDASGTPVKDFVSVLTLHYLGKKLRGLPALSGKWISFKELEAGELYYPAFRKRAIEPLLRKRGGTQDLDVTVDAFAGVPLRVIIWKGDEEFPADATILFDGGIAGIFRTEDVAVLAGLAAKYV